MATNVGLNVDNTFKITPLMEASKQNDYVAARVLIKSGASVNTKNIAGVTALHIASSNDSVETAKVLLEQGNAYVNVEDDEGFTPLMRACLNNNDNVVEILLLNNAEIWNENIYGENALLHSTMVDCYKCIELLSKYNDLQNVSEGSLNYMKNQIDKALVIAYGKNNGQLEEMLNNFLSNKNDNKKDKKKNKKKTKETLNDENKLLLAKLNDTNKNDANNKNKTNTLDNSNFNTVLKENKKQQILEDINGDKKFMKYGKEYIFLWQKRPISYYENLQKTNKSKTKSISKRNNNVNGVNSNSGKIKKDTVISNQPKTVVDTKNKNIKK